MNENVYGHIYIYEKYLKGLKLFSKDIKVLLVCVFRRMLYYEFTYEC